MCCKSCLVLGCRCYRVVDRYMVNIWSCLHEEILYPSFSKVRRTVPICSVTLLHRRPSGERFRCMLLLPLLRLYTSVTSAYPQCWYVDTHVLPWVNFAWWWFAIVCRARQRNSGFSHTRGEMSQCYATEPSGWLVAHVCYACESYECSYVDAWRDRGSMQVGPGSALNWQVSIK